LFWESSPAQVIAAVSQPKQTKKKADPKSLMAWAMASGMAVNDIPSAD